MPQDILNLPSTAKVAERLQVWMAWSDAALHDYVRALLISERLNCRYRRYYHYGMSTYADPHLWSRPANKRATDGNTAYLTAPLYLNALALSNTLRPNYLPSSARIREVVRLIYIRVQIWCRQSLSLEVPVSELASWMFFCEYQVSCHT